MALLGLIHHPSEAAAVFALNLCFLELGVLLDAREPAREPTPQTFQYNFLSNHRHYNSQLQCILAKDLLCSLLDNGRRLILALGTDLLPAVVYDEEAWRSPACGQAACVVTTSYNP